MRPFNFRLEKVLNYRRHLEKEAIGRLMQLKKGYASQEAAIAGLKAEKNGHLLTRIHAIGLYGRFGIDTEISRESGRIPSRQVWRSRRVGPAFHTCVRAIHCKKAISPW